MKIKTLKIGSCTGAALTTKDEIVEIDDYRGGLFVKHGLAEKAEDNAVATRTIGGGNRPPAPRSRTSTAAKAAKAAAPATPAPKTEPGK